MSPRHTLLSEEEFNAYSSRLQRQNDYRRPLGFGMCRIIAPEFGRGVPSFEFFMVNWNENHGTAATLQDAAGLYQSAEAQRSEAIVHVTPGMIKGAANAFAPYFASASETNHRNAYIIKLLAQKTPEELADMRLVVVYEDTAPKSRLARELKNLAYRAGKIKAFTTGDDVPALTP